MGRARNIRREVTVNRGLLLLEGELRRASVDVRGAYMWSLTVLATAERESALYECLVSGSEPMSCDEWAAECGFKRIDHGRRVWLALFEAGLFEEVEVEGETFARVVAFGTHQRRRVRPARRSEGASSSLDGASTRSSCAQDVHETCSRRARDVQEMRSGFIAAQGVANGNGEKSLYPIPMGSGRSLNRDRSPTDPDGIGTHRNRDRPERAREGPTALGALLPAVGDGPGGGGAPRSTLPLVEDIVRVTGDRGFAKRGWRNRIARIAAAPKGPALLRALVHAVERDSDPRRAMGAGRTVIEHPASLMTAELMYLERELCGG